MLVPNNIYFGILIFKAQYGSIPEIRGPQCGSMSKYLLNFSGQKQNLGQIFFSNKEERRKKKKKDEFRRISVPKNILFQSLHACKNRK